MARAHKGTRTIKRTQKKTVPAIFLELGEGEADFLQSVLAAIGGSEKDSPRKYAVRIARALENATGQDYKETDAFKLRAGGYILYDNYPEPDAEGNVEAAMNYMKSQYATGGPLARGDWHIGL